MGKLTKRIKKRNNLKKNTRKGGGYGCAMSGGKKRNKRTKSRRKVKGGSPHLEALPIRYYYPLNEHSSSLSNISSIGSSTQQFSGGKRNKTRKRIKGGGLSDAFFSGPQLNIDTGFGTTIGPTIAYDMIRLDQSHMVDVLKQPAGDLNNAHSPLLA
jgi:hypothetical protein